LQYIENGVLKSTNSNWKSLNKKIESFKIIKPIISCIKIIGGNYLLDYTYVYSNGIYREVLNLLLWIDYILLLSNFFRWIIINEAIICLNFLHIVMHEWSMQPTLNWGDNIQLNSILHSSLLQSLLAMHIIPISRLVKYLIWSY